VNKTTVSAAQLAKCILLHAYSRTTILQLPAAWNNWGWKSLKS